MRRPGNSRSTPLPEGPVSRVMKAATAAFASGGFVLLLMPGIEMPATRSVSAVAGFICLAGLAALIYGIYVKATTALPEGRRCEGLQPAMPASRRRPRASGEGSCVVCLEALRPGAQERVLQCSHVFHPRCIEAWCSQRRTAACPVCRAPVGRAARAPLPGSAPRLRAPVGGAAPLEVDAVAVSV